MPSIISLISWPHERTRFIRRSLPISGFRRFTSSGFCVAIPSYTFRSGSFGTSGIQARATPRCNVYRIRAKGDRFHNVRAVPNTASPLQQIRCSGSLPASGVRPRWQVQAQSEYRHDRVCVWVQRPSPPRKPSIAMISAPLRATPLAIAATLCTAAILTITGFL